MIDIVFMSTIHVVDSCGTGDTIFKYPQKLCRNERYRCDANFIYSCGTGETIFKYPRELWNDPPPPNRAMCGFVFGRILMLRLPTRSWRWLHVPKCVTFNTLSRLSCVFDSVLHVTRSSHLFSFPPHIFANGTVMPSSVLGMNLFGGKFCTHPTERRACTCAEQIADIGCKCARKNFDTLLWSLVTVFQVNSRAFRRGSRCGVAGGGSYVGTTGSCAKSSHLDACIRHKFWCCCCAIKGLVETRRLATTWHCDLFR